MVLVILFLLILEKADNAEAIEQTAAAARSGAVSALDGEASRTNGSGSLHIELEQTSPAVR
jgi:hypothetical protein